MSFMAIGMVNPPVSMAISSTESYLFFSGAGLNTEVLTPAEIQTFLTGPDDFDYLASGLGGGDYNNDDDLIPPHQEEMPTVSMLLVASTWMVKMA